MSNLGYKQAVNVDRRTWDKEAFEARAKARLNNEIGPSKTEHEPTRKQPIPTTTKDEEKEEFVAALPGSAGPGISKRAYLKSRTKKIDLESKVGKSEIISAEALAKPSAEVQITDGVTKSSTGVGWYCKVCDCFLKDSHTYLDHINGRKHQRHLGFTMRVERSTADEVRNRMSELAASIGAAKKSSLSSLNKSSTGGSEDNNDSSTNAFEDMVKAKDEDALRRKAARARKREERKKQREAEEKAEEEKYENEIDPDMAAMMGFSSFGGK